MFGGVDRDGAAAAPQAYLACVALRRWYAARTAQGRPNLRDSTI